ncbi:MAG: ABC transporter ATP-binding protein [Anaerolineaceae bacterium]|jgi:putative ABC transport system ATP-binding protein|nr:MAG: ABC transporter ATP-binding protein [Anaerolineaceae bacterium]
MTRKVVDAQNLIKTYQMSEDVQVHALRGLSFSVKAGEVVSIMGPSGSGKSTLMNILGCLDRPTSGQYFLDGEDVSQLNDDKLADIRNRRIGFVFQNYNLLPRTSALGNVMLPLRYNRDGKTNHKELATSMLEQVGLGDRIDHKPYELSGGQQQRVAIARALINDPAIILADEPTGNLDSKSGEEIMELLLKLNKEKKVTLIIVTHDPDIAKFTQRAIHLIDGKVKE